MGYKEGANGRPNVHFLQLVMLFHTAVKTNELYPDKRPWAEP